jgi:hypothetical protein
MDASGGSGWGRGGATASLLDGTSAASELMWRLWRSPSTCSRTRHSEQRKGASRQIRFYLDRGKAQSISASGIDGEGNQTDALQSTIGQADSFCLLSRLNNA